MFVYTNENTGQVVELPERNVRLDYLRNWSLASETPAAVPELESAPAGPVPDLSGLSEEQLRDLARPTEQDNKAAWVAFAVACGMTEPDAKALSKASLIEEFGEA